MLLVAVTLYSVWKIKASWCIAGAVSQEHVFWVVSLNTLFIMVFGKNHNCNMILIVT